MTIPPAISQPPVPLLHHPRAAIRISAFFIHLVSCYLVYIIGRLIASGSRSRRRRWREAMFTGWARRTLWILGVKLQVIGSPPPPPAILVSNHLGYLDIIVLAACSPSRFLSKIEVASWPVIGRIVRSVDTLFIDRTNYRDLDRISDEIADVYAQGESVTFFPEGTSHNGQEVLPLRSPLLKMPAQKGLSVAPVGITYSTDSLDYPAYRDVCWWDNVNFFFHLYRCCAIQAIYAQVNFQHPPVQAANRKIFAINLHAAIRKLTRP